MEWDDIKRKALEEIKRRGLSGEYLKRLKDELREINKQGANTYWVDNCKNKFDHNKNGLVLPFLLGMTDIDPIKGRFIYVEDVGGFDSEMIIITLEDNNVLEIPRGMKVMLVDGSLKEVSRLEAGDDILL